MIEVVFSMFRSQARVLLGSVLLIFLLAAATLPDSRRSADPPPWQGIELSEDKSQAALIQQGLMLDKVWLGSAGWQPNEESQQAGLEAETVITYVLVGTAFDGGKAVAYLLASDDRFLLATAGQALANGAEVVEIKEQSVVLRPAETSETINLSLYSYE